jgi:uncharacterized protein (TIGR02757 family)
MFSIADIKILLDEKAAFYNNPKFIETDPIQVPKLFSRKEDIEIAAFLASTIAWGQRSVIIRNAMRLIGMMDNAPFDFVLNSEEKDLRVFNKFSHRTFNNDDCKYFVFSLKNIYRNHGGMQKVFENGFHDGNSVKDAFAVFYKLFFGMEVFLPRTRKHISNVAAGSACKRLNMFLRWMIRNDDAGVDFGLWGGIPPSALMLPLDVHVGRITRKLGILNRKQNDWKAVEEATSFLKLLDPNDPVKYDFALFGLGAFEKI